MNDKVTTDDFGTSEEHRYKILQLIGFANDEPPIISKRISYNHVNFYIKLLRNPMLTGGQAVGSLR